MSAARLLLILSLNVALSSATSSEDSDRQLSSISSSVSLPDSEYSSYVAGFDGQRTFATISARSVKVCGPSKITKWIVSPNKLSIVCYSTSLALDTMTFWPIALRVRVVIIWPVSWRGHVLRVSYIMYTGLGNCSKQSSFLQTSKVSFAVVITDILSKNCYGKHKA